VGDFNIKPDEPVYQFLTTGELPEDSPFYPTPKHGMEWKRTMTPMKSAYALMHTDGKEPDFTNYALAEGQDEPFIDTLDFIFVSEDDWAVTDVRELPDRDAAQGPFPNLDVHEPSDHLMIAASLECVRESK
jgi:endonuclease/exonuclease/phosphatase family metal-dependent hydrolase